MHYKAAEVKNASFLGTIFMHSHHDVSGKNDIFKNW